METLFDAAELAAIKQRFSGLGPESPPLWGKMNVAQMITHCARSLETAVGDRVAPRMFLGRILGSVIKPMALKDGEPFRKNSPTSPDLLITEPGEFEAERTRLFTLMDRFAAQSQNGKRMHSFFGSMTAQEWSKLMHKHLDHHLRQFGV